MRTRFLVLIASENEEAARRKARIRTICNGNADLRVGIDLPNLQLLTSIGAPVRMLGRGRGAVLGPLFSRESAQRVGILGGQWEATIDASRGGALTRDFWGDYVALIHDADSGETHVLRAPFGSLPCLIVRQGEDVLLASDLDLLTLGGWKSTGIAWDQLVLHLANRDIRNQQTCLLGVDELRGGERASIRGSTVTLEQLWSPWDHAGRHRWESERADFVDAVRGAVSLGISASTATADHPLLMLSGGLDSSIVAASLAASGLQFDCLNLASTGGIGDERHHARVVADALGVPLTEALWCLDHVDVTHSDAARMPRPSARSFMQETDRLVREAAAAVGADLIIDGGGGDNVFCSLQSVAPVADAILYGGDLREAWASAATVAELAQSSIATVLTRAIQRACRRSPRYRWPRDTRFLTDVASNSVRLTTDHPWLEPPEGAEPGTAAHIALLAAAQSWAEGFDPMTPLAHASPLASQPVVETCLGAPSWWWFRDGRNRAVAREAFADCLPAETVRRSSKGSPDSFIAELFERNRPAIQAMLLDGHLCAQGLLDLKALGPVLDDPRPVHGGDYRRVMRLVDTEAWAANWA